MQGQRTVQVVLGEGEPGILRFILEAEGFHVVGQARGDKELERVLAVTRPTVVVLDAGISAPAALAARTQAEGAPVVVVWPAGVVPPMAEERVDPTTVIQDLGGAVRRAAARAAPEPVDEDTVVIPDSPEVPAERRVVAAPAGIYAPQTAASGRGQRRMLAVAAAWVLVLTASAAIGLAIPRALDVLEPLETPDAPSPTKPDPAPSSTDHPGREGVQPIGPGPGSSCDRTPERSTGPRLERGRPDDPGRGCGQQDGKSKKSKESKGEQGTGRGRPDEPGDRGKGKGRSEDQEPRGGGQPPGQGESGNKDKDKDKDQDQGTGKGTGQGRGQGTGLGQGDREREGEGQNQGQGKG